MIIIIIWASFSTITFPFFSFASSSKQLTKITPPHVSQDSCDVHSVSSSVQQMVASSSKLHLAGRRRSSAGSASAPAHRRPPHLLSSAFLSVHCGTQARLPPIPPPAADPARHGQLRQREGGHAADGWSRQKGQSVRILLGRDVRVKDPLILCSVSVYRECKGGGIVRRSRQRPSTRRRRHKNPKDICIVCAQGPVRTCGVPLR